MPDLSDGINWSEIDANNNNAPPNGWPEGMMPSGVNDAARADRGAMKRFWDKINPVQGITPSGGVYTFITDNPAYPTAYVNGEIYCFRTDTPSVGGDQFQVNALGVKPILKRLTSGAGGLAAIIAQDIQNSDVQLVYNSHQNAGLGAFILLNPFVPVSGDGAGGVIVPNLTVAGILVMAGPVIADDGMLVNGALQVVGPMSATGYSSRSGTAGPYQTNVFNIQWAGADGAHLWIDTTDQGPIVTAPGGNIVIGGSISAGSMTASGNISAATLSVSGNTTLAGTLSVSGNTTLAGTLSVTGNTTATNLYAGVLTGGTLQVNGNGNVSGNLTCSNNATIAGTMTATYVQANGTATINGELITSNGVVNGPFNVYTGPTGIDGPLTVTGNVGINGNLTVSGLLNGHPAMAMTEFMTQLDALTARVQVLEGR